MRKTNNLLCDIHRRRVDTYDHAVNSGLCAGQNMARPNGKMMFYSHQPSFRSVLHGTGLILQGFGEVNSNLQTVGVWFSRPDDSTSIPSSASSLISTSSSTALLSSTSSTSSLGSSNITSNNLKYNRGIVYYIRNNKVVGVLLCNAPETLDQAREVIREQKLLDNPSVDLKHRILLAPEHWLHVITTNPQKP